MTILIVDDHPANRKLLRVQLEGEGFCVVEATDGVEALQVLARAPVHAVISDILMPRMDGYRLCHEVRKDPGLRELRFILYSSTYTAPEDVRLCTTVGADQFIAKPAPVAVILDALRMAAWVRVPRPTAPAHEGVILQEYSAVLVAKLEEKNLERQEALEALGRTYRQVLELNEELEGRVRERTADLVAANHKLTAALAENRQLNTLLPICSFCKKIRDDKDYWASVECYVEQHTNSKFSHGVCPACYEQHYVPALREMGIEPAGKDPGGGQ